MPRAAANAAQHGARHGPDQRACFSAPYIDSQSDIFCSIAESLWDIQASHLISKLHWLRKTEGRRTSLISQSTRASSFSMTLNTLR